MTIAKVKGRRTHHTTGKTQWHEYTLEKKPHGVFLCGDNVVTGYESFCLDAPKSQHERCAKNGWFACAGTEGRWDELFIPPEEMKKALVELGFL